MDVEPIEIIRQVLPESRAGDTFSAAADGFLIMASVGSTDVLIAVFRDLTDPDPSVLARLNCLNAASPGAHVLSHVGGKLFYQYHLAVPLPVDGDSFQKRVSGAVTEAKRGYRYLKK